MSYKLKRGQQCPGPLSAKNHPRTGLFRVLGSPEFVSASSELQMSPSGRRGQSPAIHFLGPVLVFGEADCPHPSFC